MSLFLVSFFWVETGGAGAADLTETASEILPENSSQEETEETEVMSIVIEHQANGQHAVRAICLNADQASGMAPTASVELNRDSSAPSTMLGAIFLP